MPNLSQYNLADPQSFVLLFPTFPPSIMRDPTIGSQHGRPETIDRNRPFELNIFGTVLPTLSFEIDETNHMLRHKEIISRITYEQWSTSFLIDEQFQNYLIMFQWLQYIDANIGEKHTKKDYSIEATLEVNSNYRKKAAAFHFIGLSPISLGEVGFNYQELDYLTCEVTFEYDQILLDA